MAARHARQRGMLTLARHLREEIVAYRGPARDCYASAIYRRISKAMRESPEAKFPEVVDSLRRDYGMSRRDFVGRYRRARAVFDQARSSVLQYSAAVAYRKGHRAARTRRGQSS